jgi:aldehyde:ferredoxin oxidoreductase
MFGYAGKILRVNLTNKSISSIPTSDYEQWGGGHGMGSAIFFDLVKDKTIDGFHPDNVVTIMTSPLSGTLTPGCSSRTEVQGIGVQPYPIGWFTRSNFGGRFSPMLKFAGWDGIVIEGAAAAPVWIDIRDDDVQIRECSALSLWGTDTWECQQAIWDYVAGSGTYEEWMTLNAAQGTLSTQRPAVLAIGPAGENLSRLAAIVHDAANACGQGGFGAVWGSKNLKAVSVIGTGSITIADPDAMIEHRINQVKQYAYDYNNPKDAVSPNLFQSPPGQGATWERFPNFMQSAGKRPHACIGCHSGCKRRYESGLGNEAQCAETTFYLAAKTPEILYQATDLLNKYGINALEAYNTVQYVKKLTTNGIIGPGKEIDSPLNFDNWGSLEFIEQFFNMISYRNDGLGNASQFGEDIADGALRAAEKWGRLEQDLSTGDLMYPYWGFPFHYDPRVQFEWGYGSILGDRDINEHCIMRLYTYADPKYFADSPTPPTIEELVQIITRKMAPFQDDMLMLDYSADNMYSEHIAKLVAWHRYYTRFWKESIQFCDNRWPDFVNSNAPDLVGSTGDAEPRFFTAVTGKDFTFLDGINVGKKIWNLDHAIWTLQGRHRDMVHFAEYIYKLPYSATAKIIGREAGAWKIISVDATSGRYLEKDKFEEFKTRYYQLEGWDTATGYPTRSTLEDLGLGYVADELEAKGKLGSG